MSQKTTKAKRRGFMSAQESYRTWLRKKLGYCLATVVAEKKDTAHGPHIKV